MVRPLQFELLEPRCMLSADGVLPVGMPPDLMLPGLGDKPDASVLVGKVVVSDGEAVGQIEQPVEKPIPDVVVRLLDEHGQLVTQVETNSQGQYQFSHLKAGWYSIHQAQPDGYFEGRAEIGNGGGNTLGPNLIVDVNVQSGGQYSGYKFVELSSPLSPPGGGIPVYPAGPSPFKASELGVVQFSKAESTFHVTVDRAVTSSTRFQLEGVPDPLSNRDLEIMVSSEPSERHLLPGAKVTLREMEPSNTTADRWPDEIWQDVLRVGQAFQPDSPSRQGFPA